MRAGTKQGKLEARAIWDGDPEKQAKLLWEWQSSSSKKIATAPAAADGFIVVGSDDGHIYGFEYSHGKSQ